MKKRAAHCGKRVGGKKVLGVSVATLLAFGASYAAPVQVNCQFFDQESNSVGDGNYTYDPSTSDRFSYQTELGGAVVYETNYATEFLPNITLKADVGWNEGDYQFTGVISNIWAGNNPGTLKQLGASPFSKLDTGWHKYPLNKCSGCDNSALSMNWDNSTSGVWGGMHESQNIMGPNSTIFERHSSGGTFVCETPRLNSTFEGVVYFDAEVASGKWVQIATPDDTITSATVVSGPASSSNVVIDSDYDSHGVKVHVNTIPVGSESENVVIHLMNANGAETEVTIKVVAEIQPMADTAATVATCSLQDEQGQAGTMTFKYDRRTLNMEEVSDMNMPHYVTHIRQVIPTLGHVTEHSLNVLLNMGGGVYTQNNIDLPGKIFTYPSYGQIKLNNNNEEHLVSDTWDLSTGRAGLYSGQIHFKGRSENPMDGTWEIMSQSYGENKGAFTCSLASEGAAEVALRKEALLTLLASTEMNEEVKASLTNKIQSATSLQQLAGLEQEIEEAHNVWLSGKVLGQRKTELRTFVNLKTMSDQDRMGILHDISIAPSLGALADMELRIEAAHQAWKESQDFEQRRTELRALVSSNAMSDQDRAVILHDISMASSLDALVGMNLRIETSHHAWEESQALKQRKTELRALIHLKIMSDQDRESILSEIEVATSIKALANIEPRIQQFHDDYMTSQVLEKARVDALGLLAKSQLFDGDRSSLYAQIVAASSVEALVLIRNDLLYAQQRFLEYVALEKLRLELNEILRNTTLSSDDRAVIQSIINNTQSLEELNTVPDMIEVAVQKYIDTLNQAEKERIEILRIELQSELSRAIVDKGDYQEINTQVLLATSEVDANRIRHAIAQAVQMRVARDEVRALIHRSDLEQEAKDLFFNKVNGATTIEELNQLKLDIDKTIAENPEIVSLNQERTLDWIKEMRSDSAIQGFQYRHANWATFHYILKNGKLAYLTSNGQYEVITEAEHDYSKLERQIDVSGKSGGGSMSWLILGLAVLRLRNRIT